MSVLSVQSPYPIFTDTDGDPLESGYVWIGVANLDPQVNPLAVFWDAALTMPAVQPIRTLAGYPAQSGSPGRLYSSVDYSIRVLNKRGSIVFSAPNSSNNGLNLFSADLANNTDPLKGAALVGYNGPDGLGYSVDDLANKTNNALGSSLIGHLASGANQKGRTVHDLLEERYSVFNSMTTAQIADVKAGTMTLDVSSAINTALASSHKNIYFPAGRYRVDFTLVIGSDISLCGDGPGKTILDGSLAVYANLTDGKLMSVTCGSITQISDLNTSIAKNDRSVVFDVAPGLSRGDIFIVYDETDFGFSGFRSYYRKGEFCKVATVAGLTVTTQAVINDNYTNVLCDCYKLNGSSFSIKDLSIECLSDTANQTSGIVVNYSNNCMFENISVKGASYVQVDTYMCFYIHVNNCNFGEDFSNDFGGDYGFSTFSSQNIFINNSYFASSRHGVTIGGGSGGIIVLPTRNVFISNCFVTSLTDAQAMDCHGNTEFLYISQSIIDGGAVISGNNIKYENCIIKGLKNLSGSNTIPFLVSEPRGMAITVENCELHSYSVDTDRGIFFDCGGNSNNLSANTYRGGTLSILNNKMIYFGTVSSTTYNIIKVINRGYVGPETIDVSIEKNTITSNIASIGYTAIQVSTGNQFGKIVYRYNDCFNCGSLRVITDVVGGYTCNTLSFENNLIYNCINSSLLTDVKNDLFIKNNNIASCENYAVLASGSAGKLTNFIHLSGNCFKDNNKTINSTSYQQCAVIMLYFKNIASTANVTGTNNKTLPVTNNSSFSIGDTITGVTSGATAIVHSKTGATFLNIKDTESTVKFQNGEVINGAPSLGSTTTTAVSATTETYAYSYLLSTNLWHGRNININNTANNIDTVTNVVAI